MPKTEKHRRLGKLVNYRGSRAERLVYSILYELLQNKIILEIEDCTGNSVNNEGKPDFKITKNDNSFLTLEIKSSLMGVQEYKQSHPGIPVIMVYPYWEIHPKFRRFDEEGVRVHIRNTILALLHDTKTGGETC